MVRFFQVYKKYLKDLTIFFVNVRPNLALAISAPKKFCRIPQMILTFSLLKSKIGCGKDNMSTTLFKEIMPNKISPVVHILNLSLESGYIPVIPIYREFTNYRPISLLSSFLELLEKLLAHQMFKFIIKCNIMHSHQYGLRLKHDI